MNTISTSLTAAEKLVAAHVAEGLSNKEIASMLNKAEPTIKNQVASILRKTGAPSRCRFIAQLLRGGLGASGLQLVNQPFPPPASFELPEMSLPYGSGEMAESSLTWMK